VEVVRGVGVTVVTWATELIIQEDLSQECDRDVWSDWEGRAVHLEHVGLAVVLIVEETRDGVRIEVTESVAIYDGEAEFLEIHEHVQNLSVGESALTFHQVNKCLVVHHHRERFAIAEIHGPVHDGVVEAECLAFSCPPFCSVVVLVIVRRYRVVDTLAEVGDWSPIIIPSGRVLW
jgi:hypothetical protein